ncbi:hypothetical protein L596_014347 [Steinernema carpocapsae]|uniref:Uncharacterized protein n=1 Tax=Steinernema carpocapsae TaxID=34508 RepID=A0A4V6A2S7_STECR|nr:hypothetical protein L596_014347 [Steinernema carpocapsae]
MLTAQLILACLLAVFACALGYSSYPASETEDSRAVPFVPLPYGYWQSPQQFLDTNDELDDSQRLKRSKWASQIRYGKRASWASQVRFG